MTNTLDQPQDPVFRTVKVTPSHAPPATAVRPDPFIQPVTQPSRPTDSALASPTTDPSQQGSTAKATSSAQPELATCSTSTQPVQRELSSAFDTSKKDTPSSSDSESDSLSSD